MIDDPIPYRLTDSAIEATQAEYVRRAQQAHRIDRWSLLVAMRGPLPERPPMGDLPASLPLPRDWVRTRWDLDWLSSEQITWDLGVAR